jgi:hypothetical protein
MVGVIEKHALAPALCCKQQVTVPARGSRTTSTSSTSSPCTCVPTSERAVAGRLPVPSNSNIPESGVAWGGGGNNETVHPWSGGQLYCCCRPKHTTTIHIFHGQCGCRLRRYRRDIQFPLRDSCPGFTGMKKMWMGAVLWHISDPERPRTTIRIFSGHFRYSRKGGPTIHSKIVYFQPQGLKIFQLWSVDCREVSYCR